MLQLETNLHVNFAKNWVERTKLYNHPETICTSKFVAISKLLFGLMNLNLHKLYMLVGCIFWCSLDDRANVSISNKPKICVSTSFTQNLQLLIFFIQPDITHHHFPSTECIVSLSLEALETHNTLRLLSLKTNPGKLLNLKELV